MANKNKKGQAITDAENLKSDSFISGICGKIIKNKSKSNLMKFCHSQFED
ncbi:hypothetical protein FEDK69T_20760 [Flavobacterium enshiense DK69]|nr:hypothetical protein FEDK69T_20760 [Flavobacterium enshiense DK69]